MTTPLHKKSTAIAGLAYLLLVLPTIHMVISETRDNRAQRDHLALETKVLTERAALYALASALANYRGTRFGLIETDSEALERQRSAVRERIDALDPQLAQYPISHESWTMWRAIADRALASTDFVTYSIALDELLSFTELFTTEVNIGALVSGDSRDVLDISASTARLEEKVAQMRGLYLIEFDGVGPMRVGVLWGIQRQLHYLEKKLTTLGEGNKLLQRFRASRDNLRVLLDPDERPAGSPVEAGQAQRWWEQTSAAILELSALRQLADARLVNHLQTDWSGNQDDLWLLVAVSALGVLVSLAAVPYYWRLVRSEANLLARLHENEYRYRVAVDGSNVGVFDRPDMSRDDVYWSPQLRTMLGVEADAPVGPLFALVHPTHRAIIDKARGELARTPMTKQLQAPLRCGDGEYRWFSMNAVSHNDLSSGTVRLSGSVIDVHEVKEVERLRESERALEAAVRELEDKNEDLERFARMASHDLQEPLRMVTAFTSLLELDYAEQLDSNARDYIEFARDGAQRMQVMIDDLLAYARAGANVDDYREVDVQVALDEILANMHDAIGAAQAQVDAHDLPVVFADPTGLRCVLQNLIGNAVKYHRVGCPPRVTVVGHVTAEIWQIEVRDNGLGIEAKHFDTIFEPFERLHGQEEFQGNGIGLALCAKLVEAWGGSLDVESTPGEGSVFKVRVPRVDQHLRVA